jgi:hypothetical protein
MGVGEEWDRGSAPSPSPPQRPGVELPMEGTGIPESMLGVERATSEQEQPQRTGPGGDVDSYHRHPCKLGIRARET